MPCGLTWPSSCLTLAQVSLIVSPFFSPLSLRHGFVVVCFEVTTCELLCLLAAPCDLGDPGWGDPWFPHGAFVASLTSRYGLGFLFGLSLLFLLPYLVKMIQGYHSCINSTMNWYLSHFCLAGLSWVAAFCFGRVFLVWFFVWLLICLFLVLAVVSVCFGDVVTGWTVYRSYTRSLLKPLNLQAAMFALIRSFTLVCNMQLNVLDDLAEAMKALDGKEKKGSFLHARPSLRLPSPKLTNVALH